MAFYRCKGIPINPIFGNASDDDGTGTVTLGNTSWNNNGGTGAEDTGVVLKQYNNLIIPNGVIVQMAQRNSGMIIKCKGNCTINGTLKNLLAAKTHSDTSYQVYYPQALLSSVCANGGSGGNSNDGTMQTWQGTTFVEKHLGGSGMGGRFYGGGYGGGGAGGLGHWVFNDSEYHRGNVRSNNGGGGSASEWFGSGGYGAPDDYGGGAGGTSIGGNGSDGFYRAVQSWSYYYGGGGGGAGGSAGGVIILLVAGEIIVNGSILANGGNGGNGGNAATATGTTSQNGAGGGGGAGGRVYIGYHGAYSNNGSININGGFGGTGLNDGANGGTGQFYYEKI